MRCKNNRVGNKIRQKKIEPPYEMKDFPHGGVLHSPSAFSFIILSISFVLIFVVSFPFVIFVLCTFSFLHLVLFLYFLFSF